ncbi:MAG: hypothetical protein H0V17_35910, partial [Deltaproteobacteria bacterium]|nr:hypothetical protein [Deltaproteobacteria bacterium]
MFGDLGWLSREGRSTVYRTELGRLRVFDESDLEHGRAAAAFVGIRHPNLYPADWVGQHAGCLALHGPWVEPLPALPPFRDYVLGLVAQITQAAAALQERGVTYGHIEKSSVGCVSEEMWGSRVVLLDRVVMTGASTANT